MGKSALVNQFLWEIFIQDYHPTVEEFNWIEYDCSESAISDGSSKENQHSSLMLQVIDSSGSRDFLAMRHLYYKIGNAFIVSS